MRNRAMSFVLLLLLLFLLALAHGAHAQVADKKVLTLAGAQAIVEAALSAANSNQLRQSIAVVDDGGNLLAFARMDDAQLAGVQMAIGKARTALMFQGPSKGFADRIAAGQLNVLGLPGMLPADGGQPLVYGGKIVGAIGVSGASPAQDGQSAVKAAATLR
jgi:glc operon protein GlcG